MGSTSLFALSFPELTDAPNGPEQIKALAEGVDGRLARAFPCTSSTKPTLTAADRGFLADVSDLARLERWDGAAWQVVGGASTGGGTGGGGGTSLISTVSATYAATSAQPISSGADVVVAFGVAQVTDSAVTRNTSGAGHSFTFNQSRLWIVTATVRFAQNPSGGRTFELRTSGGAVLAKESGPQDTDAPWTANLTVARKFNAGASVQVIARHNAGTSLALEPNGGDWCHIDLAGV